MKKIIFGALFLGITFSIHASENIRVFVEEVTLGEIDPYLGEGCVLIVRDQDKRYGLVNRDSECLSEGETLQQLQWTWIEIDTENLTRIRSKKDISLLKQTFGEYIRYSGWNGVKEALPFRFSRVSEFTAKGLKKLLKLGQKLVEKQYGGNTADLQTYRLEESEFENTFLSLDERVKQLLYSADNANTLTQVLVEEFIASGESLYETVSDLLNPAVDQERRTELAKFKNRLLFRLLALSENEDNEFARGLVTFNENRHSSFIAVHNIATGEYIILIQGQHR